MSAPPTISAITLLTLGVQGPPSVELSFAGLSVVTFAQSGLALTSGGFYPVDTTGGPVTLQAPAAVDGALFGVSDLLNHSAINPIILNAVGVGVTIGDPSNRGAFATQVHISDPSAPTTWWAYFQSATKWIPIWW
jgi:hypothetical protein